MRYLLVLPCLLVSACEAPSVENNCGMTIRDGAGWFTEEMLQEVVRLTVLAPGVKEFRLQNPEHNCNSLSGFNITIRREPRWVGVGGEVVAGQTFCAGLAVESGTPYKEFRPLDGQLWRRTALVHELFHVMQSCFSPPPTDEGISDSHSNWDRDGILHSIGIINRPPSLKPAEP